jgi:hypothetical protein
MGRTLQIAIGVAVTIARAAAKQHVPVPTLRHDSG